MRTTLPSDQAAPARARHLADSYLQDLGVDPQVRRSVQLMVSELVTNAVQHGGPPIRFTIRAHAEHLVVEVKDCGPPLPQDLAPRDVARGRGLFIVEQLSSHWGERSHSQGKTVWCDVSLTPQTQR
jgi:anti-sigma regulatory factor (Ser/Thr protein kinase)